MNSHRNARLNFEGRKLLVERFAVMVLMVAAETAGINPRTSRKWRDRFVEHGLQGLRDHRSRPLRTRSTLDEGMLQRIALLRRRRMPMRSIATVVGLSVATVSRVIAQLSLYGLNTQDPKEPVVRSEREAPGEFLHMDRKKLGRIAAQGHRAMGDPRDHSSGASWEVAYGAVDDHSRVGFVQILLDEKLSSATSFLHAAAAHYRALGVTINRITTDNGPAYRSQLFAKICQSLGIKHTFTLPYCLQSNGKAERFIRTCLRRCAHARIWANSAERPAWLPSLLTYYNARRPHSALGFQSPSSRIAGNNLLQLTL